MHRILIPLFVIVAIFLIYHFETSHFKDGEYQNRTPDSLMYLGWKPVTRQEYVRFDKFDPVMRFPPVKKISAVERALSNFTPNKYEDPVFIANNIRARPLADYLNS